MLVSSRSAAIFAPEWVNAVNKIPTAVKGGGRAPQKRRLTIQVLQRRVKISKILVNCSVLLFCFLELHPSPGTRKSTSSFPSHRMKAY